VSAPPLHRAVGSVDGQAEELVALRRDLHAHPELAWQEQRTTTVVAEHLERAGLDVKLLPKSGLLAELGSGGGPVVALRADLDALPVDDRGEQAIAGRYASRYDGVAHACGHDVHTSALVGAGVALREAHRHADIGGRVRLLFQPAEEVMPGGALELIATGALDGVDRVFGLHCDPTIDVGDVGLRAGPLTGAADSLAVRVTGRGGHTSRPHLTEDLTYAIGKLVTELPGALSRRLDPRAGASLVWGMVRAGSAKNVIPAAGEVAGTLRMLDAVAWADAEDLVRELIGQILAPYGVGWEVTYVRGVPPVVNETSSTELLCRAVGSVLGPERAVGTTQSLGGEDFAWYLESLPGAMARLGTRTPGGPTYDLHRGDLHIDERAIGIGAKVLAAAVLTTLSTGQGAAGAVS
jgi:amidohydrolase